MIPQPDRRAMIAKIHIAKKQLALHEDSYRALLGRVAGRGSCADCTDAQLAAVLSEFGRLGFEAKKKFAGKQADHSYTRMIYSLWSGLKPYLTDSSHSALRSFVRRQTGRDAPEFLGPEESNLVIEGLKAWLQRERVKRGVKARDVKARDVKARGEKAPEERQEQK